VALYGAFETNTHSKIFDNTDFGYRTITVERPKRDPEGAVVVIAKGKRKGEVEPDPNLRDTENIPLKEDVLAYFEREVVPHAPDAWISDEKCDAKDGKPGIVGYEIPFTRHFYVFKPPRDLAEIDADLKVVTDKIKTMIDGLSA
jgi:type I restriction enzyme M protein